MKRSTSYSVLIAMLATLAAIAVAAYVAWYQIADHQGGGEKTGSSGITPAVEIGGPFSLTSHKGETVTPADFRGEYMLIYFGYAYCPDVCPTELTAMSQALDEMDDAVADRVQPIFITVDPARDTPQFLADYVTHFHPRMIGLTGTEEQVAKAAKAYRVYYSKVESEESTQYLMDHSSFVYLMGPEGGFETIFRYGTGPEKMAEEIERRVQNAG